MLDIPTLASLLDGRVPALCNNRTLASGLVARLCTALNVELKTKRLDRFSDLRPFLGDPRNPVSYQLSEFHRLAASGGLLFIEALESSAAVIQNLRLLEPLLPRSRGTWRLPNYADHTHTAVHPRFFIVLSFPHGVVAALPPSLASRLELIELEPHSEDASPEPTVGVELGPNRVLVLMKFGVAAYEEWYETVLEPSIEQLGTCVRLTKGLEDWQSDVNRAIQRADAVVVDLSHDLTPGISSNVLWELNHLWQTARSERPNGSLARKMIFTARGLDGRRSIHRQRDFIYSSELGGDLIADMPTSASSVEQLLGFEIRRYDPSQNSSRAAFTDWFLLKLEPLVQNVPPPFTDAEMRKCAQRHPLAANGTPESRWIEAIASRDFDQCGELADRAGIPEPVLELLGDLLATVSVSHVIDVKKYWAFVKKVLAASARLRAHYRALLASRQLSLNDPFVVNFCENVWLAFVSIEKKLPPEELKQLAELAMTERRMFMREVSDQFRVAHLPHVQQRVELARLLAEHMAHHKDRENRR